LFKKCRLDNDIFRKKYYIDLRVDSYINYVFEIGFNLMVGVRGCEY
jgi:hypothetical protein